MKFYVTAENTERLKRSFLNLKFFKLIDVGEIVKKNGYTYDNIDEYVTFIVSSEIDSYISAYIKSKSIRGIIYINENLTESIITTLHNRLYNVSEISEIVLMDDYNVPKLKALYKNFAEIIFFPSIKKVRLIECKPFPVTIKPSE